MNQRDRAMWRCLVMAFIGAWLIFPIFVGRDLNEPHMTMTVVLGSMVLALSTSQLLAALGNGVRGVGMALALLGGLFALLPWLAPEHSPALGTYHGMAHLVPGAVIVTLGVLNAVTSDQQ
jgi:hypothetical protein